MVPLIKLEDSGYKPIDPKKIRLPPPTPPTERLLAALELFYAPPSHERPRDPEGWEMIGLYEWNRDKAEAIKQKQEDIESGKRQRSPTASPDPYEDEDDQPRRSSVSPPPQKTPEPAIKEKKKKRYTEEGDPEAASRRNRKRQRSRSRSRTRSRSRGSTPDRGRGRRRSQSPEYTMPSYLTKRSPSPEMPMMGAAQMSSLDTRIDSSNKGHQMMERMGWKAGSGLGTAESGIVEPISGGEVRDRADQYRGVGVGQDPFEAFRRQKSGNFHTRMKDRVSDSSSGPRK